MTKVKFALALFASALTLSFVSPLSADETAEEEVEEVKEEEKPE